MFHSQAKIICLRVKQHANDYSMLLGLFGKSVLNILFLWRHGQKEVFTDEFQQEIQWQPLRMFAVKNASHAVFWFFTLVNLAFF